MKRRLPLSAVVALFIMISAPGLATTIFDVQYNESEQGTGNDCYPSPLDGQQVVLSGVVTAVLPGDYPDFWLQSVSGGPWTGIFVYDPTVEPVMRGKISAEEALHSAADKLNRELSESQ